MSLLTTYNVSKQFGPEEIFAGVTLEIPQKARIALVGPNGAGKTTLLNILYDSEAPTSGTVTRARGLRLGFLPQRPELEGEHTLWEEQLSAFADLLRLEEDVQHLENQMSSAMGCTVPGALEKYGQLQEEFERRGGYTYESRIRMVLQGMGFKPEDYPKPLDQLSGGQKTRALLARLLLQAPDVLLLDEPTNHLDIDAVEWLEGFLRDFPGAVLVVSHDRYFMDHVATTIWEMDFGEVTVYRGNYSAYLAQRGARYERLQKEFAAQQEMIAKEEDYIRRNIAGQNTKQAQGRRTRLERLKQNPERYGLITRPPKRQQLKLALVSSGRSGDRVLHTKGLVVGREAHKPLFSVPDITLQRGETAALIGPNGVGKTTLLKTILGQLPALAGTSTIGAAVQIGYFAQAHEALDEKKTLLDELLSVKNMPLSAARDYLALYLFQGDDVFRHVSTLSGGERGRLALAKLALAGANFLLLDEPTNHLDIASQEILQDVLNQFEGTILLVSHDRYLIDALATQIWSARPGSLRVFKGTYAAFVEARALEEQAAAQPAAANQPRPASANKKQGLNPYELRKKIAEIEDNIHTLETRQQQLSAEIERASSSGDTARVLTLGSEYTQVENALHAALHTWEQLVE
ncbi:MAG: ABC-F family ATP-binding cassette domain-containing protein [Chloroflexi bacterium]|nr:ABC-F family ATP-binding cassette domain-containing protein [Chloroflexota bacterium]